VRIYEDLRVVQSRLAVLQAMAVALVVVLVILVATVMDALLLQWLASAFSLPVTGLSPLALVSRAALNAFVGGLVFAVVDRRLGSRP
jgi:hypothetical protein